MLVRGRRAIADRQHLVGGLKLLGSVPSAEENTQKENHRANEKVHPEDRDRFPADGMRGDSILLF